MLRADLKSMWNMFKKYSILFVFFVFSQESLKRWIITEGFDFSESKYQNLPILDMEKHFNFSDRDFQFYGYDYIS